MASLLATEEWLLHGLPGLVGLTQQALDIGDGAVAHGMFRLLDQVALQHGKLHTVVVDLLNC